jgi:hypothetical protein
MSTQTPSFPMDYFWKSKLALIQKLTKEGNEGDRHFLQVTKVPLTCMYLEAGAIDPNGNGTDRKVHMRLVGQPENYPVVPDGQIAMTNEGYRRHVARVVSSHQANENDTSTVTPFALWSAKFLSITNVIDNLIAPHHGVCCHIDGNTSNESLDNLHYLHVCDVINIIGRKTTSRPLPGVVVTTPMFTRVPETMVDVLSTICLNEHQLEFFLTELDYFYVLYGYYVNGSFIPIRTSVDTDDELFVHSSFFMNDEHFLNQQRGKLQELNRTENTITDNIMFRSI